MVQEKRAGICVHGGKKAWEVMKDDLPGFFCNWRGKRWLGFNCRVIRSGMGDKSKV
jgi:hypothetical protein